MTSTNSEFCEIALCGSTIKVRGEAGPEGARRISTHITHSAPTAAAWYSIWATPDGVPVAVVPIMGMGDRSERIPGCYQVMICSDIHGMFGHQCPRCNEYWRSRSAPPTWPLTCPYCRLRAPTHVFVSPGQRKYVEQYCQIFSEVVNAEVDLERVIDVDAIVKEAATAVQRPKIYYAEESQQNKFDCGVCRDTTDILGRYGYCSCCGTHNGAVELKRELKGIHERITAGGPYENCVKEAVAAFDGLAGHYAKQLVALVPMTPGRRREWGAMRFHNLERGVGDWKTVFDIDLTKGISPGDLAFATRMFHRRHVYEHKGGEVDQKYIDESGDTEVKVKQVIRETEESARKLTGVVQRFGDNLQAGFQSIFPAEKTAVEVCGQGIKS